jgi:hypothetical protein
VGTQDTQSVGQFREMVKSILDRLPTDLSTSVGYHQEPAWFNRQIAALVKMDRKSKAARLAEALLNGDIAEAAIAELLSHIVNPYANERLEPRFFYPEGYTPNSVEEQLTRLLVHLDWLDTSHVEWLAASWAMDTYLQADGLYVVPKPSVLAAHLELSDHWNNFGLLTEQGPLAVLAASRKFTNYRAGELGPDRYRLAVSARVALEQLEAEQPGDLLVFPAQTGKLYAGFSPRNSRWETEHVTNPSQWPMPAYVDGWIIAANPHRLEKYEHLVIDCPGDEYRFEADGEFDEVLYFYVNGDGALYCDYRWTVDPYDGCGSASGFLW